MTYRHHGHLSAATRAKISARLKGRHHRGHPMSASARAKISAKLKGRTHKGHAQSAATRAKISAKLKGRHHKGHPMSASARAKLAAKLKGRHHKVSRRPSKAVRQALHLRSPQRARHALRRPVRHRTWRLQRIHRRRSSRRRRH